MTSLKTGYELKKLAGNLDSEVEQGELKIQIRKLQENSIEVQEVLLKAKQEILDNRETILEKDNKIFELENKLKIKEKLVCQNGKYYEIDESGKPTGEPYCSRCWDLGKTPIHLIQIEEDYFKCPECKNTLGKRKPLSSSDGYY